MSQDSENNKKVTGPHRFKKGDAKAGERRKDVTDEIVSHIARLLAKGKK
jgi:hypothetical protein